MPNSDQVVKNRDWYKRLGKRIKLSLNKPEIEKNIEELRNFNSDFNLMANQIINSIKDTTVRNNATALVQTTGVPNLIKYQNMQKASQQLYETLVQKWSCSLHSRHSANISLLGGVDEAKTRVLQAKNLVTVRVDMAITYHADKLSGDEPIWLEVESFVNTGLIRTFSGLQKLQEVSAALGQGSEQFMTQAKLPEKGKAKAQRHVSGTAKVRFDIDPAVPAIQMQSLTMQPVPLQCTPTAKDESPHDVCLDLCLITDVCEHFQSHQKHSPETCVGYLRDASVQQRFYQRPAEKRLNGKPKTLEDIILWVSEDPIRVLPRVVMFQLATWLATAVLRYHSTPWLSEVWRSKDVVFFGINDFRQGNVSLRHPHLNVDFCRDKGKRTATNALENSSISSDLTQGTVGARNEILFRLGIVLLEVGFATPWPTLRENMLKTLANGTPTDYCIADKLARRLVNSMGPKYSMVIRKCLGCDFGLGETDLASEDLQERFLLDVVVALRGLEERMPIT